MSWFQFFVITQRWQKIHGTTIKPDNFYFVFSFKQNIFKEERWTTLVIGCKRSMDISSIIELIKYIQKGGTKETSDAVHFDCHLKSMESWMGMGIQWSVIVVVSRRLLPFRNLHDVQETWHYPSTVSTIVYSTVSFNYSLTTFPFPINMESHIRHLLAC